MKHPHDEHIHLTAEAARAHGMALAGVSGE